MADISCLPEIFSALCIRAPADFTISERILNPVIVIDKIGQRIVAVLGGVRVHKGGKSIYRAPSNRHAWVLDGNIIRPIPRDAPHFFSTMMQDADPENLPYSKVIQLMRESTALITVELSAAFVEAGQVTAASFAAEIVIPGLTATLLPYQARGVRWMWETVNHTGGLILADEMGLGKTLQIIALLLMDKPKDSAPALIICPTSLIANWMREFSRFAADISILVHRGARRTGVYLGLQTASVVITTYDTMVNDIAIFSSFEWAWLICDEAQAIKNPDSNRRQAVMTIPRKRTIPMTGTPVENSLLDLWALIDFAIPGLLGTRREFETTYPDSRESAQTLGCLVDPLILKRRIVDVANDLPARRDIDVPLELDEQLADHYIQVRDSTIAKYPVAGALVATLQLQLVCAHPWLRNVNDNESDAENAEIVPMNTYPLMTPKMDYASVVLREAFFNKRKVIVFAQFNRLGELLKTTLCSTEGIFWGAINGATPQEIRQQVIDEFSAYDGPGCLVLNPRAAGAGLNITAATIVIHFTPVWNPALETQASARAYRRGQTQPVTIYRLFYKDTVEEVMIERALWKQDLANDSVPVSVRDTTDIKRALTITPRKT